ncbi:ABC transporter substrate-binding protein [Leifsonia sp. YAF41]|uniref:ABC transporter substrate-binding protein n=1 Tax=Leifsonia sp. YAF41 TaxID=3233086 RepID=UPI003F98F1DA
MSSKKRSRLVAGAAVLAVALAGCAGTNANRTEKLELVETTAPAVAGLDKLVWNLPYGEPFSLDPAQSAGESNSTVIGNVCESLLRINPDFSVEPNIAEVEQVDDLHYRISLRDGVTFSTGAPVTVDDVIYSMTRYFDVELGSSWSTNYTSVTSIDATGDSEVTVTLSEPDAFFYNGLALPSGVIIDRTSVESAGDAFGTPAGLPVCTGPYVLDSWDKGEQITLTKNDAYWNEERAALTPTVEFKFLMDTAAATTALKTGDINGAFNFPISSIPQLSGGAGSIAYGRGLGLTSIIFVHVEDGPLADPKLREALTLAVDYEGIRSGMFANAAELNKTLTPKSAWGYSEDIFQEAWDALPEVTTDLERAAELVKEAGPQSEPIVLSYISGIPESVQIATAMKDAAEGIGLKLELNAQTEAENIAMYFDDEARVGTDLMLWEGYLDVPDPAAYYVMYTSDTLFNAPGFKNAEFDQLVADARTTLDDDERARIITEAQRIYSENLNIIPLVSQYTRLFQSAGVTGASPTQTFLYSPWAASVGKAAE